MFSPNQLYDYLRYYCITNKKNVEVLNCTDLGSKNLDDLVHAKTPHIPENLQTHVNRGEIHAQRETGGTMVMLDQEPLDVNAYCIVTKEFLRHDNAIGHKQITLTDDEFFLYRSKGIYNPIIAVSEINSKDVSRVTSNFHIPFYFWSNAFLSRYWYSMYEMLSPINNDNKNKFGCYIRDVTGTRKYRKNILQMLANSTIDVYCPILDNRNIELPSELSATIDWQDQSKFDIHIVPETIFNTEKVHLTEKIFKPIVMYQPFILFGGARSLEYLRSYGFKTFGDLWDESYDYEEDADIRFKKITDLISNLNNLNPTDYKKLIQQTNKIAKFNREHFYSDKFYKTLKNELHKNLKEALQLREEQFYTNPGGTLFYFDNLYLNEFGVKPRRGVDHKKALEYAYSKSKSVGDAIVKKYSHLL
jgi:hypothetical protein